MNFNPPTKVLIVDNDFSVRAGLKAYLLEEGFQVLDAGDEETAWQIATTHTLQAAIVDIALPATSTASSVSRREEICGLRLAARLKETYPPLGVVFYSAYPEYRREVVDLIYTWHRGVVYKLKGCLPSALLAALKESLEGGVWIDPEVTDPPSLADELLERLAPDERLWVERALTGLGQLTPQEREIARRIAASHNTQGIATALSISPGSVENHISRIYFKLGLSDLKTQAPQLRNVVILTKAWMLYDLQKGKLA